MAGPHTEEIVWTETADGLRHHGLVIRPRRPNPERLTVVWVHGATLSFSDRLPVLVGRRLAARGRTFVTGNNRGHHALVPLGFRDGRMVPGGTWAERFSESALDVAAWTDVAAGLGAARVVLVGHSYGGAKVVCYQAERGDARVAGVVSASAPVRFDRTLGGPEAALLAERMVAEGRGDQLLPYGMLGARNPNTRTAAAYLDIVRNLPDVFGSESEDPPVSRLRCPLLALYGTDERHLWTEDDLDVVRRNARAVPRVETRVLAGDHLYTGQEAALADVLADWVASLPGA